MSSRIESLKDRIHAAGGRVLQRSIVSWMLAGAWIGMPFAAGACALIGVAGCDDKSAPPPSVADNTNADNAEPADGKPTTQSLLEGPRTTKDLGGVPVTIEVPKGWDFHSYGGIPPLVNLEGPGPHGDVRIMISAEPGRSAQMVAAMEASEQKEQREHPNTILMSEVRNIGPARIFDQRKIDRITPATTNSASTGPVDMISWTVTIFTPVEHDQEYQVEMLTFIGLSREQYDQDKEFLEKIIRSIQYNPLAGG